MDGLMNHAVRALLKAAGRALYRAKLAGGNASQFNAADPAETVVI